MLYIWQMRSRSLFISIRSMIQLKLSSPMTHSTVFTFILLGLNHQTRTVGKVRHQNILRRAMERMQFGYKKDELGLSKHLGPRPKFCCSPWTTVIFSMGMLSFLGIYCKNCCWRTDWLWPKSSCMTQCTGPHLNSLWAWSGLVLLYEFCVTLCFLMIFIQTPSQIVQTTFILKQQTIWLSHTKPFSYQV